MRTYTNEKMIEINSNNFWENKVMPKINRHRILHCRKVSKIGIPIVYKKQDDFVLDMYMYNHKSIKGKRHYHKNSKGEIVLPKVYRYYIDKETYSNFYCTESLGKKYNDAIKKVNTIKPGIKIADFMNDLDKAPTEKQIAKLAKILI